VGELTPDIARQLDLPGNACLRFPEQPIGEMRAYLAALRSDDTQAQFHTLLDKSLHLMSNDGPPAIIAPNDALALHILTALRERNLRPGEDVGVIGFDDMPEAVVSGLTSVHPPWEQLGAMAYQLISRLLAGYTFCPGIR
jgi:DNA-binding LacI/PurR family transcriptional regulator